MASLDNAPTPPPQAALVAPPKPPTPLQVAAALVLDGPPRLVRAHAATEDGGVADDCRTSPDGVRHVAILTYTLRPLATTRRSARKVVRIVVADGEIDQQFATELAARAAAEIEARFCLASASDAQPTEPVVLSERQMDAVQTAAAEMEEGLDDDLDDPAAAAEHAPARAAKLLATPHLLGYLLLGGGGGTYDSETLAADGALRDGVVADFFFGWRRQRTHVGARQEGQTPMSKKSLRELAGMLGRSA